MTDYSRPEAAERAGIDVQSLDRLVALDVITPTPAGRFTAGDIRRAMVVQSFVTAGIPLEGLAAALQRPATGLTLDFFDNPAYERMTALSDLTFHQAQLQTGVPLDLLTAIREIGGSPTPDPDARLTEGEVPVLEFVAYALQLGVPPPAMERLLRVYGDALHRVAQTEADLYSHDVMRPRVATWTDAASMAAFEATEGERFTDLSDAARTAVLHTQQGHAWTAGIVAYFEQVLAEEGLHSRLERPPAMCFLDLTGYTRLTAERGDAAAAALAGDLERLVHRTSVSHGGRPVKWLGDGVMFHFPDPGQGVVAALGMRDGVIDAGLPPAHVGLHAGPIIFQAGDYYGQTVNIASRIAEYARPGEVLVSQAVVDAGGTDPVAVAYADVGEVDLKGVAGPLRLYAASRA